LEALAAQPYSELDWLLGQQPRLKPLPAALKLGLAEPHEQPVAQTRAAAGIPGRKWAQICAFSAQVPPGQQPLLDWCSGKAHLGRHLASHQLRPLHAIERNASLCEQGQDLARRQGLNCSYQVADVLNDPTRIPGDAHVVALHACGDLHRTLVNHPQLDLAHHISLAPCCYHLWLPEHYHPLSQLGQHLDLHLSRNQVQLAVQDLVHAPARERRAHQTMAAWRLAFDSLQRELRGIDAYLPTPSLPHRQLKEGFASFIHQLAAAKHLCVPSSLNWAAWEAAGWDRFERARRLQVVRHAFRRPLELWLALDIALRLEERGFAVNIATFCPRKVTPRNILLQGFRPG
jgi:hypothetical protein